MVRAEIDKVIRATRYYNNMCLSSIAENSNLSPAIEYEKLEFSNRNNFHQVEPKRETKNRTEIRSEKTSDLNLIKLNLNNAIKVF